MLELVQYLVKVDPDCIRAETHCGYLPIHVMPSMMMTTTINNDQVESDQVKARLFMIQKFPAGLTHENEYGRTPLSEAIKAKCNIILEAMVDASPDIAIQKDSEGRVPLHTAVEEGNYDAFNILVSRNPGCICEEDNYGKSPITRSFLTTSEEARQLVGVMAKIISEQSITKLLLARAPQALAGRTVALETNTEANDIGVSSSARTAPVVGKSEACTGVKEEEASGRAPRAMIPEDPMSVTLRCLMEARKSEEIFLSKLCCGQELSNVDLKAIIGTLVARLSELNEERSWAPKTASLCQKNQKKQRGEHLCLLIQALHNKLLEMEGKKVPSIGERAAKRARLAEDDPSCSIS